MGKKGGGPQETEADRALAQVAKARVADFRTRWAPQQRKLAGQLDAMGAENSFERRAVRGAVTADTDVAFADAGQKQQQAVSLSGNTGSAGQKLGIGEMADKQASAVALNTNQANLGVDSARLGGLSSVVAMGQGKQANYDSNLMAQVGMARAVANDQASAALGEDMGRAALVGRAAGTALGSVTRDDPGVYYEQGNDGRPVRVNLRGW